MARTKEHARLILRELRNEVSQRTPESGQALEDYLNWWLEDIIRPNRADKTYYDYRSACELHVFPLKKRLYELTPAVILKWKTAITAGDRTRQVAFKLLKSALAHAVRFGVLESNPCDPVEVPRYERREIIPFTPEETTTILDAVSGTRLDAAYRLTFALGPRQGELFGLKPEDIDGRSIWIRRQLCEVSGRVYEKPPKTKAGRRMLPLSDELVECLRRHVRGETWLFTSERGSPIRRSNFGNRQWRPLLKRLGLAHRGFHHVRHTAITELLRKGVAPHIVAAIAGHRDVSFLLDTYAHWIPNDADAVREAISRDDRI